MKVIQINLSDFSELKKLSWILYSFLTAMEYTISKSEVVNIWNDLLEGKKYAFNPYSVYMRDEVLYITNKNDCCTRTSNFLLQFEVLISSEIEEYKTIQK